MRSIILFWVFVLGAKLACADLPYIPIRFELRTDKASYYEGEKITFLLTVRNIDKEKAYPVLLPHTQNTGKKLLCLQAFDKAQNTLIKRYEEDPEMHMMVHDTGSVQIKYLKPLEQITISLYLNDFENYYNYHTQTASHHSFGVPLFAGVYQVNVAYNPMGHKQSDSLYNYINHYEGELPDNGKLAMPTEGMQSSKCWVKIKRSADTLISIERKNYFILTDGHRYYYNTEYSKQINTGLNCVHITSLPPDSCSMPKDEYFYNHFTDVFAEYIMRFEDGDIKEYWKFSDYCPKDLYTEKYNDNKQKTYYALQLPNKDYYIINYLQPGNRIKQETTCNEYGSKCTERIYHYNKAGILQSIETKETQPCAEIIINGKKRGAYIGNELDGK